MYNDLILQLQLAQSILEDISEKLGEDAFTSPLSPEVDHCHYEIQLTIKRLGDKQKDLELEAQGIV